MTVAFRWPGLAGSCACPPFPGCLPGCCSLSTLLHIPRLTPSAPWQPRSGGVHRADRDLRGRHAVGAAPPAPPYRGAAAAGGAAAAARERWAGCGRSWGRYTLHNAFHCCASCTAPPCCCCCCCKPAAPSLTTARFTCRPAEEAAGNQLRQVVIPVIVLGPCGEQLQVAFDDGYLEQLAAEAAAAECPDCEGSAATGPAACDNAPASADGSSHGGSSAASSSAAVSISGGSVAEQPAEQQPDIAAPTPSQPSYSDSTGTPAAAAAAAAPPSLVQRVTCPASRSVLSVADVAALYSRADC